MYAVDDDHLRKFGGLGLGTVGLPPLTTQWSFLWLRHTGLKSVVRGRLLHSDTDSGDVMYCIFSTWSQRSLSLLLSSDMCVMTTRVRREVTSLTGTRATVGNMINEH